MESAEPHGVTELKDVRVHCYAPALHCRAVLDSRDVVEHPVQPESSAVYGHVRLLLLGNYLVFYSCFPLNHLNHFLPINSGTLPFTGPVTQLRLYPVDI